MKQGHLSCSSHADDSPWLLLGWNGERVICLQLDFFFYEHYILRRDGRGTWSGSMTFTSKPFTRLPKTNSTALSYERRENLGGQLWRAEQSGSISCVGIDTRHVHTIVQARKCPNFGKACKPETPLGAPMVSSEGACAAYYHFSGMLEELETVQP